MPIPLRALAPFAFTLVFAAACAAPLGDTSGPAFDELEAQSLVADAAPATAPVSRVTPIEGGGFRFTSTAVLDVPEGAAWAKIHNIEKVVEIALPGIASDFQWIGGGGPSKVPSRFQFSALGSGVLEEVFFVDGEDRVLKYRLVTPALGIQRYSAAISLDAIDHNHTRITFSRDLVFEDPASVDAFAALFAQEIASLRAYFANHTG